MGGDGGLRCDLLPCPIKDRTDRRVGHRVGWRLEAMTAYQWLLYVGVPSLFVIVFLVWEWRWKTRVRLEEQSSLTVDGPDHIPPPCKLEPPKTS